MKNDIDILKKKLIYRSQYRSTREMDKLIGNFVRTNIEKLNLNQLGELDEFLNYDDDILYRFYNKQISQNELNNNYVFKLFKNYIYKE
mgnify:CR=1 FL=1